MSLLNILVLRTQRWSIIRPSLRRKMLNIIGAQINPTAIIEHSCWLTSARIKMGAGSMLNAFAFVDGTDWLILDDGARVAVRSTIITRTHGVGSDPAHRSDHSRDTIAAVCIGAGSWVGAGCTILPGCDIAPGCVIGAGTVVNKPIEPNGLYVGGSAARRIRDLAA